MAVGAVDLVYVISIRDYIETHTSPRCAFRRTNKEKKKFWCEFAETKMN